MRDKKHFPLPLLVEPVWGEDWRKRKVIADFVYIMSDDACKPIIVPAGFITDYASIPRFLWSWLPSWGPYGPAAVVHDYLYRRRAAITVPNPNTPSQKIKNSRKIADDIFYLAMRHCGVGWIKRQVIYWAVRLCGGAAWEK